MRKNTIELMAAKSYEKIYLFGLFKLSDRIPLYTDQLFVHIKLYSKFGGKRGDFDH